MKIFVVGLNHKSAPVAVREKLAFDATGTLRALRMLKNSFPQAEFVLLSTCNRVELYSARKAVTGPVAEEMIKFLSEFHNVQRKDFQGFLYVYTDEDAVRHLLTVASSLDSMVVGEVQIIGQVKESYKLACGAGSTGKVLSRVALMARLVHRNCPKAALKATKSPVDRVVPRAVLQATMAKIARVAAAG